MAEYTHLLQRIEEYLRSINFKGNPAELYDPVQYMMELGGKRVRPLLVTLGCHVAGGDMEQSLPAAAAVEVFHNFTLVHDDIMDKAPVRRGKPTVHTRWNADIAILAGDLMMIKSMQLLNSLPAQLVQPCMDQFLKTAAEVCEGQQLDMNFEQQATVTVDEYLHMIELKTAVLLACSLKLGALTAGASTADADHLYAFGRNLGIAFQLQDDILDVFAGNGFGKQTGGDIIANKKTYLLIKALELATGETRARLEAQLRNTSSDTATKVQAVTAIYEELHVRELAEAAMNHHLEEAWAHLAAVAAPDMRKQPLRQLALALQQRNT